MVRFSEFELFYHDSIFQLRDPKSVGSGCASNPIFRVSATTLPPAKNVSKLATEPPSRFLAWRNLNGGAMQNRVLVLNSEVECLLKYYNFATTR